MTFKLSSIPSPSIYPGDPGDPGEPKFLVHFLTIYTLLLFPLTLFRNKRPIGSPGSPGSPVLIGGGGAREGGRIISIICSLDFARWLPFMSFYKQVKPHHLQDILLYLL